MAGRAFPGEVWLRPQRNGRGFGLDELAQAAVRILDADGLEGLTMRRTAYDGTGRVVEFGRSVYRPTLYDFSMTLVTH